MCPWGSAEPPHYFYFMKYLPATFTLQEEGLSVPGLYVPPAAAALLAALYLMTPGLLLLRWELLLVLTHSGGPAQLPHAGDAAVPPLPCLLQLPACRMAYM
jgi:hypothetical protein